MRDEDVQDYGSRCILSVCLVVCPGPYKVPRLQSLPGRQVACHKAKTSIRPSWIGHGIGIGISLGWDYGTGAITDSQDWKELRAQAPTLEGLATPTCTSWATGSGRSSVRLSPLPQVLRSIEDESTEPSSIAMQSS